MFGKAKAERQKEKVVLEAEFKTQMAINIQTGYRQHLAKRELLKAMEERADLDFYRSYCADILQCTARCFNARRRLHKRLRAVVLITALGRGFLARRKALKRRQVLEEQALYVAPHKLRPERYQVPPGLDLRRPPKQSKARTFKAEAKDSLLQRLPSPLPWSVRQKQAVQDFQSKPKIKAFFSGLQKREHGKGKSSNKAPAGKPPAKAAAPPPVNLLPEKTVARPASAMQSRTPLLAEAVARPASALPSMATKSRVPPRFQKVRQAKAAAGDSGAESTNSVKKPKPRNQRPRTRGSDSERNSDDEEAALRPAHVTMAPAVPAPMHMQSSMPTQMPPRASYNKDDISSDPPSDEKRKKRSKDKGPDKEKRKAERSVSPPPPKVVSPPPKPASNVDPKIEAAFSHCRLGKYREVEKALEEKVPVESRFGPDNNTMLLQCAQNGQKRIAKLLLRSFADMNAQNDKGDTAMHYCFKFKYNELGEYLKSKGADDKIRNSKGQTCYECQK